MRRISLKAIAVFHFLIALALLLTWLPTAALHRWLADSAYCLLIVGFIAAVLFCLFAILVQRAFNAIRPIPVGDLAPGSPGELNYHVYVLFYLLIFNSLIRTHFIPVTLGRILYLLLGAKLGRNTYCAGVILDPPMVRIGENTILGHDCVVFAHVLEGPRLAYSSVRIGSGVTIGAHAVVMPGVTIGDNAIVAINAVVSKGSVIGSGEIWGGTPASFIRRVDDTAANSMNSVQG
ncbi:MAG: acyltransferase [Casimicrobium sp.]